MTDVNTTVRDLNAANRHQYTDKAADVRNDNAVSVPTALLAAVALVLPPLQAQAWWLILPCLVCLILRWHTIAFVLLFAAVPEADGWPSGLYFLSLVLLLLMRMSTGPAGTALSQLGKAGRQVLLALPVLMLLAAVMLVAGAGWSERTPDNSARTGVSDRMTPGSVSELVNDGNLAMRVGFNDVTESDADVDNDGGSGPVLLPQDLYWRGLVLEHFDGRSWTRENQLMFDLDPPPVITGQQSRLLYQVTLEPTRQVWLYGLHQAHTTRADTYRDSRGMLISADIIRQRIRYPVTSVTPQRELDLHGSMRERNLALPAGSNPQTRQWVAGLRRTHPDDHDFSRTVLQYFNQQPFFYTLTPAVARVQAQTQTLSNSVDDFLFNSREGYCEHYASALTFTLRAAGIPARVVAGYQGGEQNPITGHWSVYQFNAHAWVEAWYPDTGWQRLDPTLSVAPERIIQGIDAWLAALGNDEARANLDGGTRLRMLLGDIPGFDSARHGLDALQHGWNLSVYDADGDLRTEELATWLESRGLGNLPVWLLALLLLAVGLRAMFGERTHGRRQRSPVIQAYMRLDARLQKQGLGRMPSETIRAHLTRISEWLPEQAGALHELGQLMTVAEYSNDSNEQRDVSARMHQLIRFVRPARR
jgi:protein-glutamine gamma-glutamyltransferase